MNRTFYYLLTVILIIALLFGFAHSVRSESNVVATQYSVVVGQVELDVLSHHGIVNSNLTVIWNGEVFIRNFETTSEYDVLKVSETDVSPAHIFEDGVEIPVYNLAGPLPRTPSCVVYNKLVNGKTVYRFLLSGNGMVTGQYGPDGVFGWDGYGMWDVEYTELYTPVVTIDNASVSCLMLIDSDLVDMFAPSIPKPPKRIYLPQIHG